MGNYTAKEKGVAEVMMSRYIESKFNDIEPWVEESIKDVVENYGGAEILNLISRGDSLENIFEDIVGSSLYHLASAYLTYNKEEEEAVMEYLRSDYGKFKLNCTAYTAPKNIGCHLMWVWKMLVLISGDEEIIGKVNKELKRCGVTLSTRYLCENHRDKSEGTINGLVITDNRDRDYKALANQIDDEIYAYRSDVHTINHATNYEDVVELNKKIRYEFFKLLAEYGFDYIMSKSNTLDVKFVNGAANFVFTDTLAEMARDWDNILVSLMENN